MTDDMKSFFEEFKDEPMLNSDLPRCSDLNRSGSPCKNAAYDNGLCVRHGGVERTIIDHFTRNRKNYMESVRSKSYDRKDYYKKWRKDNKEHVLRYEEEVKDKKLSYARSYKKKKIYKSKQIEYQRKYRAANPHLQWARIYGEYSPIAFLAYYIQLKALLKMELNPYKRIKYEQKIKKLKRVNFRELESRAMEHSSET